MSIFYLNLLHLALEVYDPFKLSFLRATAYAVSAHMLSQFRLSVRLSVCPSHGWISRKRLKLESYNFHHTVAPSL